MKKYIVKSMGLKSLMMLIVSFQIIFLAGCSNDEPTIGTPTVTDFTPYTDEGLTSGGHVGSVIKLSGAYYSTVIANTVKFNGVEASVVTSKTKSGSLTVVVPSGATNGKVTVTVKGHIGTSITDFTVTPGTPAPAIIDYTPISGNGVDGVEVTINGYNFSTTPAMNVVKFNGVTTVPTAATATQLKVVVPSGSTTGKLTVAVTGVTGTAASETDFTVPTPEVSGFTPSYSIVGSTVVITGTNFAKETGNNVVKFDGIAATVMEVNVKDAKANTLTVIVPVGATTGKISVGVDGVTGTSKDSFTVN